MSRITFTKMIRWRHAIGSEEPPMFQEQIAIFRIANFLLILIICLGASNSSQNLTAGVDTRRGLQDSVLIVNVPFLKKRPDFGGETCVAMYLQSLGHNVTGDEVFDMSGLNPVLGRGCTTQELVTAAKNIGFKTGAVWHRVDEEKSLDHVWEVILSDLGDRFPSVVCNAENGVEQFLLVTGYDKKTDEVIFHNPNITNGKNARADRISFLTSCLRRNSGDERKTLVALRLNHTRIKIRPSHGFTDADYAQHIRKLKRRLPNGEFHIVLQKPFVVVGDSALENVKRSATGTVKWAVDSIKKDYFEKDPFHIIDIWLFKNPESYQKHNLELFDSKPGTPFGYYSSTNGVLVMDISTGGGTLVHEIVHPFMESIFESCPSWFNEGLASLYEQSSSRRGHIVGLTNWRLRGLQLTIKDDRLPSFESLCKTTTREFYDDNAGTNYAQARYLCYYLQEKGLLVKYFHQFRKNAVDDPSGYETLKSVLGRDDMEPFQKQWEKFVLKLRFGR